MSNFNLEDLLRKILVNAQNYPRAIGYQKLTVDSTAIGFTIPTGATVALCELESSATGIAARYREDGGTPTTTDGIGRSNLDAFEVLGSNNLLEFKIVQAQGGTHTLHITYYA